MSASFAGVNAIIDSQDDSIIAVRVQQLDTATSFTGDVVLTSESGAVVTSSDGWTYVPQAGIAQLHDDVGQLGTVTAITGTGLLMGGTSLTVTLANVSAEVISISATNVTIRVAGGTPTQGDVLRHIYSWGRWPFAVGTPITVLRSPHFRPVPGSE